MKICVIENCNNKMIARGLCHNHYKHWQTYGGPYEKIPKVNRICIVPNCGGKHVAHGWCARHFEQERRKSGYKAKFTRRPETRFTDCKRYAKYRNLEWSIPFEIYKELINKLCSYCNGPLPETKVGLDRIDNFKGYLVDNVVPCCRYCNQMRSNIFEFDEFVEFSKTDLFKKVLNRLKNIK